MGRPRKPITYTIDGNITTLILTGHNRGLVETLIDTEDLEVILSFDGRWRIRCGMSGRGTPRVYGVWRENGKARSRALTRILLNPSENLEVDHINRNTLDNRRENLRVASPSENNINRCWDVRNTSGYRGVTFHRRTGKWQAQIGRRNQSNDIGSYATPEEAARAYDIAAVELYGEFAVTNGSA